jgi:prepilin-type N-terminal cleavage/methylation domain-containing protein
MRARRAFTLIEIVLAMGVFSILAGALGGIMLLSARAVPSTSTAADKASVAAGVLARLSSELEVATAVLEGDSRGITFVIPDRTGDGSDDTIRYEWTGSDTRLLTRTLDGGTPQVLAADVSAFVLSYQTATRSVTTQGSWAWTGPGSLASYSGSPTAAVNLSSGAGAALVFTPSLPAGAITYSITSVGIQTRRQGLLGQGQITVQIRDASTVPGGTIIASASVAGTSMGLSMSTQNVAFSNAVGLTPGSPITVAVIESGNTASGGLGVFGQATAGTRMYLTANGGSSWTLDAGRTLTLSVTGTYVTQGAATTATSKDLRRVEALLRVGEAASGESGLTIVLPNRPEVD